MKQFSRRSPGAWPTVVAYLAALTVFVVVPALRSRAQSGASYTITDLGPAGGISKAYGVNNGGKVVGEFAATHTAPCDQLPCHSFFWQGASLINLEAAVASNSGAAFAVNNSAYAVGNFNSGSGQRAFIWHDNNGDGDSDPGEFQDLGAPPGDSIAAAWDINDSNQVVGQSEGGETLGGHAVVWPTGQPGSVQILATLNGIGPMVARGINNLGHIVGTDSSNHGFFYNGTTNIAITNSGQSFPQAVSDNDFVVGYTSPPIGLPQTAFIWSSGSSLNALAAVNGDTGSVAYDLATVGGSLQMVGNSTGGMTRAVIWQDADADGLGIGAPQVLLSLVQNPTGWSNLQEARSINSLGQIVGFGTKNGETHGFLLSPPGVNPTPTPTPTATPTPTPIYSVSGQVKDAANTPVSGVLITFQMSFQGTPSTTSTLTDASGNYSSGDLGCKNNVLVTPSKAGFTFNPEKTAFTSSGCLNGTATANFTASASGPTPTPTPTPTPATTSLISVQGTGTYGGTATLSATLFSNDMPVNGKTISFTLNSTAVCGGGTGVTCPTTNASGVATLSGVSLAGLNPGNYPSAVGASFAGDSSYGSASQTGLLTVTPFLLFETGTNNAAAVDSVTFVRGPFRVTNNSNFSSDHLTRIIIFTSPLANPEPTLKVFASSHELQVESFGLLTGVPGLNVSYIVVKLDPVLTGSGPINYDLTVVLRGVTSNTATLTIIP